MDEKIIDASQFENGDENCIIKVIGVGGGGGNAVNYMYKQQIPNIDFVVCNTDKGALKQSPVPTKMVLGYEITHGLGAGNRPEVGRECAEASRDELRDLFQAPTEMVFITAGMGGGTGTGAAPIVAQIAKEAGMLTIGIVTVPFLFEGEKKILKAIEGAKEMQKHVDALMVINNENLVELYPDFNLFNSMEKADDTLANAARSISEIISEDCYINVDFQDVKTTLKESGTAIISTAIGEGDHRISDAINNALHSPLLKKHNIQTAKRLLLKFGCSKDSKRPVVASEIHEIHNFTSKLPQTIDVKWGIKDDPTLDDKVKVTILAAGFDLSLQENGTDIKGEGYNQDDVVLFEDENKGKDPQEEIQKNINIGEYYGKATLVQTKTIKNKMRYAVLKPSQLDDDDIIRQMERQPALNRDSKFLDVINNGKKASSSTPNRITDDPDSGEIISF